MKAKLRRQKKLAEEAQAKIEKPSKPESNNNINPNNSPTEPQNVIPFPKSTKRKNRNKSTEDKPPDSILITHNSKNSKNSKRTKKGRTIRSKDASISNNTEEEQHQQPDLGEGNDFNEAFLDQKNKEEMLSRLAALFNFDLQKDKIKIDENSEYFELRKEIVDLNNQLDNAKKNYDYIISEHEKENLNDEKEIKDLENKLKQCVELNIEKVKNENKNLTREINSLDKKFQNMIFLEKKNYNENMYLINELDNTINKLKGELNYVEDLKYRLKKLGGNEIPQDLANYINYIFKDDMAYQINNNSNIDESVRTRTGKIPIYDIIGTKKIDDKDNEVVKHLKI